MARKRLTKFQVECLERRARGAAAWGAYGAYVRQQNLNTEIRELRKRLRSEHCSESEIKERVKEHIDANSTNGLYIGG